MAILQAFHLPETGFKSVQWEKMGLHDPFRYGYLCAEARVNCKIIGGRKAGATVPPLLFDRRGNRDYWNQRISDQKNKYHIYVEFRKMVQINLFRKQKQRHRCREQTHGH